jgi:hypothetical protein
VKGVAISTCEDEDLTGPRKQGWFRYYGPVSIPASLKSLIPLPIPILDPLKDPAAIEP